MEPSKGMLNGIGNTRAVWPTRETQSRLGAQAFSWYPVTQTGSVCESFAAGV